MNNMSSYCGLVDAKIRASDKDLPVLCILTFLNTSYLTDEFIGFTLKMESVCKSTIFGKKMMVKSGVEKFILKSLHEGR